MERQTFCINFVCRESKMNKLGMAPIEMTISVNKERVFIQLPRKEIPSGFKKLIESKKSSEVKDFCMMEYSKVQSYAYSIINSGEALTATSLKEAWKKGGVNSYTIGELFDDYFKIIDGKIGVSMGADNYWKYVRARDKFYTVVDKHRQCSSISNADILTFKTLCEKEYQQGTASGYLAKVKTVIRYAIANGKLKTDPFYNIKIKKGQKEVVTISDEEYKRILEKEFDSVSLRKVQKMFIFSCCSGLAFSDIINLKPSDFTEVDGKLCIFKQRIKTKVKYYSVLLPEGEKIARELGFDLSPLKISNQKGNEYLKTIAELCKVTSVPSLHWHLGRHYYATRLINANVPIESVSKALGHSDIKMTKRYAHLLEHTIVKNISSVMNN